MQEYLFSGYCFQADQARIVEVEVEGTVIEEVDCLFENCIHRGKCEIGKRIAELEGK